MDKFIAALPALPVKLVTLPLMKTARFVHAVTMVVWKPLQEAGQLHSRPNRQFKRGNVHSLSNFQPVESITARDVAAAARRGDLLSQQILTRAGTHIGIAIAGLVNMFNPGMIIIGGGVAQTGDIILEPIRQAVQRRSLPAATRIVRITTSMLGRRSSSMGAVIQAITIALHMLQNERR